ncbi:Toxin co-regulated pilus biosynthesis protein Q [Tistlia consotensis]|uniref:Toxin co-regulated pilus biosynthesis protein Q n=1 Tax=Tistlia consotensis USBA 355 TaxID=560819 RepID=A0A1Y6BYM6_9PROT|nr:TcpQ domain-containing protein [Tistlia consotensis]SMF26949.1 Toxin co-regulated pilus biosynthesis protein Q [Tistlia consotensis USBA 355]SNR66655.1 Toxin co-regulated pilus biosynthesis protein Q [Tistlia consotensis]
MTWVATRGQTLRQVLDRWTRAAGWVLAWPEDGDYDIMADASFGGSIADAAECLVNAFASATPPPWAKIYETNRVIVVEAPAPEAWQ